jgi:hypothetical protein
LNFLIQLIIIQAQKNRNWSKFHIKLRTEPKISIMGTRLIFFKNFENFQNGRRTPKQNFIRFQVVLLFLMNYKLKAELLLWELPERIRQND